MAIFVAPRRKYQILNFLVHLKLTSSKSEAKRLIEQGGVSIKIKNQKSKIKNWKQEIRIQNGMIIQVGKRKFVKIVRH
jgi:tyrosyl-tRNA synthetase